MTRTKSLWRRQLLILFCALLLFGSMFPTAAFAADVTVSTTNTASYFQTFSSKGVWTSILTPQHTINETGQVAYCLQPSMDSPYNSGYTEDSGWNYYDSTTMIGLQAILENGYPNFTGGFTDDQARYATANAIRFWVAERGCGGSLAWMDLTKYSQFFRAASGYEDLFNWCMALVGCARTQSVIEHSAWMSSPTVTESGDYFEVTTTVYLENCDWGYTIDESVLPPGSTISGYTANNGDRLTVRIPSQYSSRDFTLKITAYDNRTTASLVFYAPDYYNQQRILTYTWSNGAEAANAAIAVTLPEPTPKLGTIRITKTDSETGAFLPGVSFDLYNAAGNVVSSGCTDANGVLEFAAEPGEYYYVESGAIEGYIPDTEKHPVTISSAGQVIELTVENTPLSGSIRVKKVDAYGNALTGAVFELEASTDSGKTYAVIGTAETDADGLAVFSELTVRDTHYRLTEIQAPPGQSLQAGSIFEGMLSVDCLELSFTVYDGTIPVLPFTGSETNSTPLILLMLGMGFFTIQILKRRNTFEENL